MTVKADHKQHILIVFFLVLLIFFPGVTNCRIFLCLVFYILVTNFNDIQQQSYEMLVNTICERSDSSNEAPGAFTVILPGLASPALPHNRHTSRDCVSDVGSLVPGSLCFPLVLHFLIFVAYTPAAFQEVQWQFDF